MRYAFCLGIHKTTLWGGGCAVGAEVLEPLLGDLMSTAVRPNHRDREIVRSMTQAC